MMGNSDMPPKAAGPGRPSPGRGDGAAPAPTPDVDGPGDGTVPGGCGNQPAVPKCGCGPLSALWRVEDAGKGLLVFRVPMFELEDFFKLIDGLRDIFYVRFGRYKDWPVWRIGVWRHEMDGGKEREEILARVVAAITTGLVGDAGPCPRCTPDDFDDVL